MTERVVLVGMMGAGKTTVGRALAERIGWDFVDLDAAVEALAGRSVAEIFAQDGEAAFRDLEHAAASLAARRTRVVIAAGGGAFVPPATRAVLREGATVVWLTCAPDTLDARIPRDGSRPLAGDRATIGALLNEREPVYRLADLAVDTTSGAPEDAARKVARALGLREARTSGE
jgi:shikimate kinase